MATGKSIMKKMHEYEAKVLTALGFGEDSPVVLRDLSPEWEYVQFKWYGTEPPEVPAAKCHIVSPDQEHGEPIRYTVSRQDLAEGVWDTILEARRDWESNFPTVTR